MKKISTEEAVGQTLCHDVTGIFPNKSKGVVFKRGHVIKEEDVQKLLNIGKEHIFVWEPEADEVHEEDAALALAEVIFGGGVDYDRRPVEGKIQATAQIDGLFKVNRAALKAINSIGDYTVACLPDNFLVSKGTKLCGARIVPLLTKRNIVEKAVATAKQNFPVFTVLPFKPLKCGVIITGSEVYYGRIEDKFEPVMQKKLRKYGAEILGFTKCPDDVDKIIDAVNAYKAKGAEMIFFTGGMSVDPDDVTPTAIRRCATEFVTQGVPMQPGNMLTLAYMDKTILIGVPGASMYFETTSLDVFLPRIFAGLEITKDEITGMGEGGFCLGCEVCRYPVCFFGRSTY